MISKAALSAALLAAVAAGVMAWLWQGARNETALLRAENAALTKEAEIAAFARDVAEARARRIAAQLETYGAAVAAMASEDIPDEALDPGIVAVLCSVRTATDPVCAGRHPAGAAGPGAGSGAPRADDD